MAMIKQRIYLDTSVISHLCHEDVPDRMRDTGSFWRDVASGEYYEAVVSDLTLAELEGCWEPRRTELFSYLDAIDYLSLPITAEARALGRAYIERGILSPKHENDCLHIALAVTSGCDVIVSWNFKHMVRMKTILGVRTVNAEKGYFKLIEIVSPTTMLREEDEES